MIPDLSARTLKTANSHSHAAFQRNGIHASDVLRQRHFADVHVRLRDPLVGAVKASVSLPPCGRHALAWSLSDGPVEHLEREEVAVVHAVSNHENVIMCCAF